MSAREPSRPVRTACVGPGVGSALFYKPLENASTSKGPHSSRSGGRGADLPEQGAF